MNSVFVNSGATIGGSGTLNVGGNQLVNSGTVTTAYGALKINGDYSPMTNGTTAIKLGVPLQVSGKAALSNSALQLLAPADTYTVKAAEQVLTAGSITGQFGSLTFGSGVFYTGTLTYSATDVTAVLTRASVQAASQAIAPQSFTTQATAGNIEAALKVADQWVTDGDTGHEAFVASAGKFLGAPNASLAAASIDSLSGEINASSQAVVFDQAERTNRVLSDRLSDLSLTRDAGGAWVSATSASGNLTKSGYASGDVDASGVLAGIDRRFTDQWLVGVAFAHDRSTADFDRLAGSSKSRSSGGSIYAQFDGGSWYANARVGKAWVDADVRRTALLGAETANITSSRDDTVTSGYLEGGWKIQTGNTTWTPFVGASVDKLNRDGIVETGAGGFGTGSQGQDLYAGGGRSWSSRQRGMGLVGRPQHPFRLCTLSAHRLGFGPRFLGVVCRCPWCVVPGRWHRHAARQRLGRCRAEYAGQQGMELVRQPGREGGPWRRAVLRAFCRCPSVLLIHHAARSHRAASSQER